VPFHLDIGDFQSAPRLLWNVTPATVQAADV
jgi:hypothetical protein